MAPRIIIGIMVRVAVDAPYACGAEHAHLIEQAVRRRLGERSDGRRPLDVELLLDSAQRVVDYAANIDDDAVAIRALDNDSTVARCNFPTVKTREVYRVICKETKAEGAPRDGYVLATRATFTSFEEAERYADGISPSRSPRIVVEVERGSW